MREVDFIVNAVKQYPRPRMKRQTNEIVEYTLKNLPPYSSIAVQIRVLNKYYVGKPSSPPLYFTTSEAGMGFLQNFLLTYLKINLWSTISLLVHE